MICIGTFMVSLCLRDGGRFDEGRRLTTQFLYNLIGVYYRELSRFFDVTPRIIPYNARPMCRHACCGAQYYVICAVKVGKPPLISTTLSRCSCSLQSPHENS